MSIIKKTLTCVCVILTVAGNSNAQQGWRGIVPLQSTCEDVKRVLGIATCEDSNFDSQSEFVAINISRYLCHEKWPHEEWNVPPGTVTYIDITVKDQRPLSSLGIDITNYEKVVRDNLPDRILYANDEEGISILASTDGRVEGISYFPAAKYRHLRCPIHRTTQSGIDGEACCPIIHGILRGHDLKNKELLDSFAITVKKGFGPGAIGYLMTYEGRRAHEGEALREAAHIKEYLVETGGIKADQIIVIDGGYREELEIELQISPRGVVPPTPFPTVHPSEAQIIKDSNEKTNNRRSPRKRRKQHRLCQ